MQSIRAALPTLSRPYPEALRARAGEIAAADKAEARRKAIERMERTRIPAIFRDVRLEEVPRKVADYAAAFRYAAGHGETFGRNLVIVGDYGTGKTEAACAVLLHAMGAERPNGSPMVVRFTDAADIKRRVTATYGGPGSEREVVEAFVAVPLLCVDDLGKGLDSKPARGALFDVINGRYHAGKPTIYTTQYGMEQLIARFIACGMDEQDASALVRRVVKQDCEVVHTRRGRRG